MGSGDTTFLYIQALCIVVMEANVAAQGDGIQRRLIGYVPLTRVGRDQLGAVAHARCTSPQKADQFKGSTVSNADAHQFLRQSLAEPLIPTAIDALDQWRLTSSGKVDRTAGPPRFTDIPPRRHLPTKSGQREANGVLSDLGEVQEVGLGDDFFKLLGHSLRLPVIAPHTSSY